MVISSVNIGNLIFLSMQLLGGDSHWSAQNKNLYWSHPLVGTETTTDCISGEGG